MSFAYYLQDCLREDELSLSHDRKYVTYFYPKPEIK